MIISYRNAAALFVLGIVSGFGGVASAVGGPYALARVLLATAVLSTVLSLVIVGIRFFRG